MSIIGELSAKFHGNRSKNERVRYWRDRFEKALTQYNTSLFVEREAIYNGTHTVDEGEAAQKAGNVRNVAYEMIESQIDTSIPQPSVKSQRRGFEYTAKMAEDSLRNDLAKMPIHKINDMNERNTPVQGVSYVLVEWNPEIEQAPHAGELELHNIHPKNLVPQPGVWDLQAGDYLFIRSSVTRAYVERRYNIDVDGEDDEHPDSNISESNEDAFIPSVDDEDGKVTVITCYFKDEDGEIGRYAYCGDTELEYLPKLYHRRMKVCQECEKQLPQDASVCECGSKRLKSQVLEQETLLEDMELEPITFTKTIKAVVMDTETGQPSVKEEQRDVIQQRILKAGTQIPYFAPRRFPVAVRINTPKNFSYGGQSDIDVIRDQQDAIKKVVSKIEAKINQSGSIITKLKDHNVTLTNLINGVIEGTAAQLSALKSLDLTPDISKDILWAQEQYRIVQSTLGINDSFQGKADTTAESGRAKQLQIQQSAGRLASKILNKHDFYKQLYTIMFELKLAFYDEMRPYVTRDSITGKDEWGDFDKYQFLCQAKDGSWFYNTDYLITSDAGQGLPNDKSWLYEQSLAMLQAQAIDLMQFWTILESIHFPNASMILSQLREQQKMIEQQQQMMAQMGAVGAQPEQGIQEPMPAQTSGSQGNFEALMGQLQPEQQQFVQQMVQSMPPEQQQAFMVLPPEQMAQAIQEAMEG